MMATHLIWAGVVLVLGVLAVRAVRAVVERRSNVEVDVGNLKVGNSQLFRRVHVLEDWQSSAKDLEDQFVNRIAGLERKLAELEPIVKQLASVPKAQPLGRRV